MYYQWAEDDFDLPYGVGLLGLSMPESGKKYVMYHGTTRQKAQAILATGFRQSASGMLGPGVYLSRDLDKASRYPIDHPDYDKVVIKVVVNVGRVIAINYQGHPRQKTWQDRRYGEVYDTAWVPPNCGMVKSGLEEDCVWDPNRIQIIKIINPTPVHGSGYGAHGYIDTDTTMEYRWDEDDFTLPDGVIRLDLPEPLSGRKYVMYHGTTRRAAHSIQASGFHQSKDGMLGPGVYLSRDLEKARRYPIDHPDSDKAVIRVVVNVGKVIAINRQGHPRQKTWHDYRYGEVFDTAWVPPDCGMVQSGLEENCVWDPNRIQITGTINPRLVQTFGYGARGFIETDTIMSYRWAEDDFDLPYGVGRLGLSEPQSCRKYVMYHGTTRRAAQAIEATGFCRSADGMLGSGIYLSRDLEKASRYPIDHPDYDKVVIKVVVNVGKVIAINRQGHPRQKTWHDSRYGAVYDTAWVPPGCGMVRSGLEENCVWDPNRIQIIKFINPLPVQAPEAPICGREYVMYHGTTKKAALGIQATGFRQSTDGMLGPGVYLSRDLEKARRYPMNLPDSDRVVFKVVVNVGKVIAINRQGHPRQKTWHNPLYGEVFDTAWVPPNCGMVKSGLEEDCVWDPTRIKIIKTIKPSAIASPSPSQTSCGARGYM
uniref:uncharacterized protein n=1 Tax=Semicossyphus pulcher TaxID=241346 RepID=UPI0037E924A1